MTDRERPSIAPQRIAHTAKHRLALPGLALLMAVLVASCTGPAVQPLSFDPAPWHDGEVSLYDLLDRNGAPLGTARWSWRRTADSWVQSYEMDVGGRSDRGEVAIGDDLRPRSAWREVAGTRYEASYSTDAISITTTNGTTASKTLKPVADGVDNDVSLQIQRALPLAAGYATRYTDIIPTTGLAVPVKLTVTDAETIAVPAGTFATWRVVLDFGSGKHDAWYGESAPHPMVKYVNRGSGAAFVLRSVSSGGAAPESPAMPAAAAAPSGDTAPSGDGALNRSFLLAAFLVQYPLMLIFPLVLGWWVRRRFEIGWGVFAAGMLTFIASQVVHLPLNYALGLLGGGRGVGLWPLVPLALVAGLSAGVCEEGARWIALRFFLRRVRGWRAAVQFGAGHGGAEAIIFGLLALLALAQMIVISTADLSSLPLSGATADQVRAAAEQYWSTPWYMAAVAGLERLFALAMHVCLAALVMRSLTSGGPAWLLAAVGLHAAADFWGVWAAPTLGSFWTELGVGLLAAGALWLVWRLREAAPSPADVPAATAVPTAADLVPRQLSPADLARRAEASKYE